MRTHGVRYSFGIALAFIALPASSFLWAESEPPAKSTQDEGALVNALMKNLGSPDPKVRNKAVAALSDLGPRAAPAATALIELLRRDPDEGIANGATFALAHIGKAALPELIKALPVRSDPKRDKRMLEVLYRFGKDAIPARDVVVPILADPDPEMRVEAAWAIAAMGDKRSLDILLERLALEKDDDVRAAICGCFRLLRPLAGRAVPALITVLKDENLRVSSQAGYALMDIGPAAIPALIKLFEDRHAALSHRVKAAWALRGMTGFQRPPPMAGVPIFISLLKDPDTEIRSEAMLVLEDIGPPAHAAIPALRKAVKEERPELRLDAAVALATICPENAETLPALLDGTRSTDPTIRKRALLLLRSHAPVIHNAVPNLLEALKRPDAQVQEAVLDALAQIGPAAVAAVPELQELTRSHNKDLKVAAEKALKKITPKN
jgi:HEAT repeat protein